MATLSTLKQHILVMILFRIISSVGKLTYSHTIKTYPCMYNDVKLNISVTIPSETPRDTLFTHVYPQGICVVQSRAWPPGLSLTKRAITSVWSTKTQILWHSSSRTYSLPPDPEFYRGSAECQVELQYQLSGIGVRSKRDGEKRDIHTPDSSPYKEAKERTPLPWEL